WKGVESRSGKGSNLVYTERVREVLPIWVRDFAIRTILDVPCGDFFWMKEVQLDVEYIGADIVAEIVNSNQKRFGNGRRRFLRVDLVKDALPAADLVLCRDCLVHLSNTDVISAVKNIKASGSTYLATTTFVDTKRNDYIPSGSWRPINLTLPPFNFPKPILAVDETPRAAEPLDGYWDKRLALWKVSEIPEM
ncbi:MAG: class I SAM-dependent methyltransferase, partial [Rhodoplanes sp.]